MRRFGEEESRFEFEWPNTHLATQAGASERGQG